MMVEFSTRLKKLRTDKHLTQAQVAKRVGVTRSMISSYETDIRFPSHDILISLCRLFSVSSDYLLCIDDKRYLDISGLTDREAATVTEMVNLLMANKAKPKEFMPILEVIYP